MKIAHVFKDFYPPLAAGITRYIADVGDAMAQRGHEVEIHVAGVRHSRRDRMPSGVVVHRHRELFRLLSMPLAPGLVREVMALDADILHVHLPNPIGELGGVLNQKASIICSFHAQLGRQQVLEPLYAPLRERLLRQAAAVITSSPALADARELRGHRDKVQVLPYGVSPRLTSKTPGTKRNSGTRLLFVGRLVYYKGVELLLRATATTPGVTLTIVGDGPERECLESIAQRLSIADRVCFRGFLDDADLLTEYSAADVFVLPSVSRAEAFGMAMSEAMANGLPAISTALGTGTDWVNINGVTGLVVAPSNVAALADAIRRMEDGQYRHRLATGARQRALTYLSFEHHAALLEGIYQTAIECPHS